MISEKDRSQLLRMAGNIACGFATSSNVHETGFIAKLSAKIAYETLLEVDRLIALNNAPGNAQQQVQPDGADKPLAG